jgi:ssDNA-binding Zn-finger/Zn-ribbon topoisomerase 1
MATCPDCDFEEIDSDELEEGDAVSCPECGRKLVLAEDGTLEVADGDDDVDDDDDDEDEDEEEDDDDDDVDDLDDDADEEEEVDE